MPLDKRYRQRNRRPKRSPRSGVAVSELAVCLPVLVLIVFGSIQATNLIYLQHAATSAAYEGMLEVGRPNATNSSVATRIQQVLDARELTNTQIRLLPEGVNISQLLRGSDLAIEVTANVEDNMVFTNFFISPEIARSTVYGSR